MKQKFTILIAAMALMIAIIVPSAEAWGESSITLNASSGFKSSYSNNNSFTVNSVGFTDNGVMYNGKGTPNGWAVKQCIQARKSGSGAGTIYNTDAINTIISVVVELVNADKSFDIYYGSTSNPSTNKIASSDITPVSSKFSYTTTTGSTSTATSYIYTFDLSSYNATYFKFENGAAASYIGSIKINYSTGYTITYNCNGAETGCPDPNVSQNQTTIPNPLPTGLTKAGHTFDGWFTDEDCTVAAVAGAAITADITLYAKWNLEEYTITYTAGEGSGENLEDTKYYGIAYEIEGNMFTAPSDKPYFIGWLGSDSQTYSPGDSYTENAALTLTAQWTSEETYDVVYDCNGVTENCPSDNSYTSGTVITLPEAPIYANHTFNGWLDDAEPAISHAAGSEYTVNGNVYFTAQWLENLATPTNFTVSAGDQQATCSWTAVDNASSYTIAYKKSTDDNFTVITGIELTSYTLENLINNELYYCKVKAISNDPNHPDSDYSNVVTVTPKAVYSITWMVNGTTESLSPSSVQDGSTIDALPTPTNIPEGFSFAGWTENENNIQFLKEPVAVNQNKTYYAVFTKGYELVTSQLSDWRGDYLIAYSSEVFMDGSLAGGKEGVGKTQTHVNPESELVDNVVSITWGDQYYVTIEAIDVDDLSKGYVIKSHSSTTPYFYHTTNSNGMSGTDNKSTAEQYPLTITFNSSSDIDLTLGGDASGAVLHYNKTTGNNGEMFRYYKNGGQESIYLYKKGDYFTRVITSNTTISGQTTATGPTTISDGSTLTISSGSTLDMGSHTLTNSNPANLVIADGGQLIINNVGVKATVKKTIEKSTTSKDSNAKWYTISSPLAENVEFENVTNLIPTSVTSTDYDLYRLDEKNGQWINSRISTGENPDFKTIDKGIGYIYSNSKASTDLAFAGEINVANVTSSVTVTSNKGNGYNLLGNPFSQNITLENVVSDGTAVLAAGYYVLSNTNTWGTKIETGTIAPLQGFLVQATTAGTVTISKPSASKGERSTENPANIEVIVENSNYSDNAYAMFGDGIGLNKINHRNADAPMVYIPQNNADFAIAFMSESTTVFPVNFKAATTGYYTISLKSSQTYEGINDFDYMYLVDNMTGVETDMLLEDGYRFIGSPADNPNRFTVTLHRDGINENENEDENENYVYQNGNSLIINGEGTLQIFDMLGRIVISQQFNGGSISTENLTSGVYVVRLTGNNVKSQKIIIR